MSVTRKKPGRPAKFKEMARASLALEAIDRELLEGVRGLIQMRERRAVSLSEAVMIVVRASTYARDLEKLDRSGKG